MNIMMVSAEAVPFSKTGGLADAVTSLGRALAAEGDSVTIILPYWPAGGSGQVPPKTLRDINTRFPLDPGPFDVRSYQLDERLTLLFIDQPTLFDRPGLYSDPTGQAYSDNAKRFTFFGRAVLEIARLQAEPIDLIHLHDWHAALLPLQLRHHSFPPPSLQKSGIVLTIHNAHFQGRFGRADWPFAGLPDTEYCPEGIEFWGDWSTLKAGILHADQITTVSPTYAKELLQPEQALGFEGILLQRQSRLSGIVNGIQTNEWDPATDTCLPMNYSAANPFAGKAECKRHLQVDWGLPARPDVPLVGMVSRLTHQKGIDSLSFLAKHLLNRDIQLVILGQGDPSLESLVTQLAQCYPDRVAAKIGFDEKLARQVYAAADWFLMPSRFEPCGLSQLFALRYGAIPIVHAVGGLIDTVVDATPQAIERRAATGFHFHQWSEASLLGALARANEAYHHRSTWEAIMTTAMKADWSWDRSICQYREVYRQAASFAAQRSVT
jgi:starch synthase